MKKLSTLLLALCVSLPLFVHSQGVPQKMNYQAVARTADGSLIANQEVGLRITINSSDNLDSPVYAEEHTVTTNKLGLINIHIGDGAVIEGSMQSIDWGSAAHYLQLFLDADNSGRFVEMGTSQLLTVPYAFYAERSGNSDDNSRGGPTNWTLEGNGATNDNINFLGTIDAQDLVFKTNDVEAGRFNQLGQLALPAGSDITFGGQNALNMDGTRNIHIGQSAGALSTGSQNSFIGYKAGLYNTTGYDNAFIGPAAGRDNTVGYRNVFIGFATGRANVSGYRNSFIGGQAGFANTTGFGNNAIGFRAGYGNTTGNRNTFVGDYAGQSNTTGDFNTFIGMDADGTAGLTNATAIGANALVTQSNSLVLGDNVNVGIGTSAPAYTLDVKGDAGISGKLHDSSGDEGTAGQMLSSTATGTDWIDGQGLADGTAAGNTVYWDGSEWVVNSANLYNNGGNVGVGTSSPDANLTVNGFDTPGNSFKVTSGGNEGVDQETESTFVNGVWVGNTIWQSVTCGITGNLTKVSLALGGYSTSETLTITIHSGTGTGGSVLATFDQAVSVPSGGAYYDFPLPSPVSLTAGDVISVTVTQAGTQTGGDYVFWYYNSPITYAGGVSNYSGRSHGLQTYTTLPSSSVLVDARGNLGVNVASPSARLDVGGNVKINDGSATTGYVLTALDGNGLASWQAPVTSQGPTGAAGTNGAIGATGPTGATGATGPLVSGSDGQTLRNDGSDWVANDYLFNTGTEVGIGTTSPSAEFEVFTQLSGLVINPDQIVDSSDVVSCNPSIWQSFTAGVTGDLTSIDLPAYDGTTDLAPVVIYQGEGTGGSVLANTTVQLPSSTSLVSITFSPAVPITAGEVYTFRISSSSNVCHFFTITDVYPGGRYIFSADEDLKFTTNVRTTAYTPTSTFVATDGNVGVGTTSPSATLDVEGSVQIVDGNEATGKVLTSDVDGNASWQDPVTSAGPTGPQGPTGPIGVDGPTGPTGLLGAGSSAGVTTYWDGSDWVLNSSNLYNNGGNVGVGTSSPTAKLSVINTGNSGNQFQVGEGGGASVDQVTETSFTNGTAISNVMWQSLTCGQTGDLTQLSFYLGPFGSGTATVAITVYSGTGIGGTVLTTFNHVLNTGSTGWYDFPVPTPVALTSGQVFTVRLATVSGASFFWYFNQPATYTGGTSSAAEFFQSRGHGVKTFMESPGSITVIDEDGNVGLGTGTPAEKLTVTGGDVYITDVTKGVIMKSPDGSCWRMTVSDVGAAVFTSIACP